jgi:hypothetical protein
MRSARTKSMPELSRKTWIVLAILCIPGAWTFGLVGTSRAQAAEAPYELVSSFGGVTEPEALAVDNEVTGSTAGDVYVYDRGLGGISRFDAAGQPAPFSATESYLQGNDLLASPAGPFEFGFGAATGLIAVDGSASGPARGDLYVADTHNERVEVFASSGESLGDVDTASATPLSGVEPCGVAVDPAGNVFIGWAGGHVDEFAPTDANPADDAFVKQLENVGEICGVAVDAAGKTYAKVRFEELLLGFEASQFGEEHPVGVPVSPAVAGFAVDPADGNLFAVENNTVVQREPAGALIGEPFGSFETATGVAVDGASGRVYVANDGEHGAVDVFAVPQPGAPAIDSEFSANVASTSVELGAQLGTGLLDTTYSFEYGTSTDYGSSTAIGDAGSGTALVKVGVVLSGLQPETTYHYRVVAKNGDSPAGILGSDHTFTTQGAGGPLVLPDGRGWEMVSPVEKNGGQVEPLSGVTLTGGGVVQASPDGERVTYDTVAAFGEAQGNPVGDQYLASRTSAGWSTSDMMSPTKSGAYSLAGFGGPYVAASTDLSRALEINGIAPVISPPLTPLAPPSYQNYYLRDNNSGALQALLTSTPDTPAGNFHLEFQGSSPDLQHIVVASVSALTPGAVNGGALLNLYEWSAAGGLQAVNVPPGVTDGETAPDAELGSGLADTRQDTSHAVSDDGSRVFWGSYVRENADRPQSPYANGKCTIPTDACTVTVGGTFWGASSSGSVAFDTSAGDLFEFDTASETSHDLTVDSETGGAGVQGVLGASNDGAYVYFVADGRLTPGATEGDCNSQGAGTSCGLYVSHSGHTTRIGTLSQADSADWTLALLNRTARVSGDGRHLVFDSAASLTGYDNTGPCIPVLETKGEIERVVGYKSGPCQEVYEYSAPTPAAEAAGAPGTLACASCNPTGERPAGPSTIPAGTPYHAFNSVYQSRVISADGSRVFFDSNDALVPQDSNNKQDVYEFEGGHDYLISSGTGNEPSEFMDASESGDDVFFRTGAQLVPQDNDQLADIYDARAPHVPGEAVGPPSSPASLACTGTGCQGLPGTPPIFATPSSVTAEGVGNFTASVSKPGAKPKSNAKSKQCKKGDVKKHNKCVKKPKKKAKAKKAKRAINHGRASR